MAEGKEVDDLINSAQKLVPPEVGLQGQEQGEHAGPRAEGAGLEEVWWWVCGWVRVSPLTFRIGRITFSLKFFEMVILSLICTSPVDTVQTAGSGAGCSRGPGGQADPPPCSRGVQNAGPARASELPPGA